MMAKSCSTAAIVALVFVLTSSASGAKFAQVEASPPAASESCEALCEQDEGMDADTCRTRCATKTDTMTNNVEDGIDDFVEGEVTNEQGGTAMEDHAEGEYGMQIQDCTPTVDIKEEPTFEDIDTEGGGLLEPITGSGDGYITMEEAQAWAAKACIPDEMMSQLFSETDLNQDGKVDSEEFEAAGEDTELEKKMDKEFDKVLPEGDDEVNTADMPDFNTFDENGDGFLTVDEVEATFKLEGERRGVNKEEMDLISEEVLDALKKMDEDGDGALNREEFERIANNDFGDESREQALADDDAEDPDDLHREGAKFLEVRRAVPVIRSALHTGARHRRASTAQRAHAAAARRMRIMAKIQAPGSASARWQAAAVAIALRKAEQTR